jgi:transposase-like protein
MISIDGFLKNITTNLVLRANNFSHIYGCKACGYSGMLHRHGHYSRNVITFHQHLVIDIERFKCPSCNKTYSRLPCCLIPYFIYSFDVVMFCLYGVYSLSHKASTLCNILRDINPDSFITVQSVSFFKKRFLTGIHLTNSFFAIFNEFSYSMDLSEFPLNDATNILLRKIYQFDASNSFNLTFSRQIHKYFMSP